MMNFNNHFPGPFIDRLYHQVGDIKATNILDSLREPSVVSVRLNPFKNRADLKTVAPVPWCKTGYYLAERPSFTLDPHYHAGAYYVQESSSMFLEEIFKQVVPNTGNLKILDLCGAPGGKATHLATLAGQGSLVVANDVVRQRASILSENVSKWGTGNVAVTSSDPAKFSALPGYFDIMVIDAPCSGEGMFRKTEVVSEWSLANTQLCSDRQKRILIDSWESLKKGGLLIYSTCTFNPGENEENIDWLLQRKGAESIRLKLDDAWGIEEIKYRDVFGYGFYPDSIMGEGFFVSVCRKNDESGGFAVPRKDRQKISGNDSAFAAEYTDADPGRLLRLNDLLICGAADTDTITLLRSKLNVLKAGTAIATVKGSVYIPGHELALSLFFRRDSFPTISVNLEDALAYLRRQSFNSISGSVGWNIIDYNGSYIGFVKDIGNRLNNYYPQEWRIRMQS